MSVIINVCLTVSPVDVDVQRTKFTPVYPIQKPTTTPLPTPCKLSVALSWPCDQSNLMSTTACLTAPEKEFLKPNPQLRTRRDSIQVRYFHLSNGKCILIVCCYFPTYVYDRVIKWMLVHVAIASLSTTWTLNLNVSLATAEAPTSTVTNWRDDSRPSTLLWKSRQTWNKEWKKLYIFF